MEDILTLQELKCYFKYNQGILPNYLQNWNFIPNSKIHNHNTRKITTLHTFKTKHEFAKKTLNYNLPYTINNTPHIIKDKVNTHSFQGFSIYVKQYIIYLIIRGCAMGHSLVPIRITARVIRRFQNNIFRRAMINMAESLRVHSLIARAALHSRASAGCNFGQTAGPSLIKFGTRGREGGEGGRGGEGRGGEGRGGEGRGGDCPHFPQTRTFVTAEPSRTPASRVTGYFVNITQTA